MKRIAVWSLLIVFLLAVPVLATETADLIIGTWETTKIIDGKSMVVVYEFMPDGVLKFKASSNGTLITDQLIPENFYYTVKDDLLFLSLVSEKRVSAIVLKIVHINRTVLKIIDVPISKNNVSLIKDITPVVLYRKFKEA